MSITTEGIVNRFPYNASGLPGEPTGMWRIAMLAPGDASGGFMRAQIVFQTTAQSLSAIVYQLGQVNITMPAVADIECVIQTANMGMGGGSIFFNRQFTLEHSAISGTTTLTPEQGKALEGALLGGPIVSNVETALNVDVANSDGNTMVVTAMGYVWDQSALYVPGGLRLPPGAIFTR